MIQLEWLSGFNRGQRHNLSLLPAPAIMAGGPHGGSGMVKVTRQIRVDPETGASLELDKSRLAVCDGTQQFGSAGSAGSAATADQPSPPVLTPTNSVVSKETKRKFTIAEVKRICSFPDDYILAGSYAKQWERLGNSVPPVMMQHIAAHLRDNIFAKIKKLKWHDRPAYVAPVIPKQEPQPEPVMETKTKKKAKAKGEPQPELTAAPEPAKAKPELPTAPPAPVEPPKPKITGKFEMADYWAKRFK